MHNSDLLLASVSNIVRESLRAEVVALFVCPEVEGNFPAVVVAWERQGDVTPLTGTHICILPHDQRGWLDSGNYWNDRATAIDDAFVRYTREVERA